jgi:hypothetical protein
VSAPQIRLTPELSREIAAGIRAGGYPYVAAEAHGVPKEVFDDWLSRGNRKNSGEPYRSFALAVRQAFAHARLWAEMKQFDAHPRLWLVHGPGRESEQRPGWSVSVKPAEATPESRNVLEDREVMEFLCAVVKALEPFPEARLHVAEVLTARGLKLDQETKGQGDKENEHGTTSV